MTTTMPGQNAGEKNNFTLHPDYGQMMEFGTNSAIVSAFIKMLFSAKNKFTIPMVFALVRNMVILLIIKTILEDSKSFLDKFKLTNLTSLKFSWQRLRNTHITYELNLIAGKWMHGTTTISTATLTPFFEQKGIYISRSENYYYSYRNNLIKISQSNLIKSHLFSLIFNQLNSTLMLILSGKIRKLFVVVKRPYKICVPNNSGIHKLEPVSVSNAYPTETYVNLETAIRNYYFIDTVMKLQSIPFCINFNGDPGTGKTTFGNYIANKGIFNRIIIYNMVQSTNSDFSTCIGDLELS